MEKEPRLPSGSYYVDLGYGNDPIANHGFLGASGALSWKGDRWVERVTTRHYEPEWGQADADKEFSSSFERDH